MADAVRFAEQARKARPQRGHFEEVNGLQDDIAQTDEERSGIGFVYRCGPLEVSGLHILLIATPLRPDQHWSCDHVLGERMCALKKSRRHGWRYGP